MDSLFFYLSKLLWAVVQPDHFLLLMLLFGYLLKHYLFGRMLLWLAFITLITIAIYPLGNFIIKPLEQRFPIPELPSNPAGIIVLGGAEQAEISKLHSSAEFNEAAERVMAITYLAKRYPEVPIIFSGGSSGIIHKTAKGSDVINLWFKQRGLSERALIDNRARNTYENALFTRKFIMADKRDWILVTSAFHMPRSIGIFRNMGMNNIIAYPVDYREFPARFRVNLNRNMAVINTAVREWIGLVAYYYTSKTAVLFPKPNKEE